MNRVIEVCFGSGDIRFNVVGESDWAVKAERKEQAMGVTERGCHCDRE